MIANLSWNFSSLVLNSQDFTELNQSLMDSYNVQYSFVISVSYYITIQVPHFKSNFVKFTPTQDEAIGSG